jgi:acetyltransferase-like isoleucine patch superfamily enzyme
MRPTNSDIIVKAFARLTVHEAMLEGLKILRGFFFHFKFDRCGSLFRAGKHIRIIKKDASIVIGHKVQLYRDVKLSAWGTKNEEAAIIIRDNTSLGDRTEIHAGIRVEIGSGCNIAWDVCIMDRDYHKCNSNIEDIKPVRICDNVWIGCRSLILKGVTIGEGSVIAAGSVVTSDVPPRAIVAGNPAKVVREGIHWLP